VAVTNKKDKTTMLPIVGKTDEHVREMMSGILSEDSMHNDAAITYERASQARIAHGGYGTNGFFSIDDPFAEAFL
jgi:hypothetical protein